MSESKWAIVTKPQDSGVSRPWLEQAQERIPGVVGIEDPNSRWGGAVAVVFEKKHAPTVAAAPEMLEALQEAPVPRDDEPPEFYAARCLKWLRTHRDPAIAKATGGEQ